MNLIDATSVIKYHIISKFICKTYKKYYTTLIKTMHIKYNHSLGKSPELRHAQASAISFPLPELPQPNYNNKNYE